MLDQLVAEFLETSNNLMLELGGVDCSETMALLRSQHCQINNIVEEQLQTILDEHCPDEPWRDSLNDDHGG